MHAWDLDTAKQLLDESCIINEVHPSTATDRDVFRLSAWCTRPELIPASMDLLIEEPQLADGEVASGRLALAYPMKISATVVPPSPPAIPPPPPAVPPPPPPLVGGPHDREDRRRRRPA